MSKCYFIAMIEHKKWISLLLILWNLLWLWPVFRTLLRRFNTFASLDLSLKLVNQWHLGLGWMNVLLVNFIKLFHVFVYVELIIFIAKYLLFNASILFKLHGLVMNPFRIRVDLSTIVNSRKVIPISYFLKIVFQARLLLFFFFTLY